MECDDRNRVTLKGKLSVPSSAISGPAEWGCMCNPCFGAYRGKICYDFSLFSWPMNIVQHLLIPFVVYEYPINLCSEYHLGGATLEIVGIFFFRIFFSFFTQMIISNLNINEFPYPLELNAGVLFLGCA